MGIITIVRNVLGELIVSLNWVFKPSQLKRSPEAQALLDQKCQGLSLYEFRRCPFCVKVRRHMHRLNIDIERRDIKKHANYRSELLKDGGRIKVPCLKIESSDGVEWLYESSDINAYLNNLLT